jgi:hypothetical protein
LWNANFLVYAGAVAGWRGGHWSSGYRSLLCLLRAINGDTPKAETRMRR